MYAIVFCVQEKVHKIEKKIAKKKHLWKMYLNLNIESMQKDLKKIVDIVCTLTVIDFYLMLSIVCSMVTFFFVECR